MPGTSGRSFVGDAERPTNHLKKESRHVSNTHMDDLSSGLSQILAPVHGFVKRGPRATPRAIA